MSDATEKVKKIKNYKKSQKSQSLKHYLIKFYKTVHAEERIINLRIGTLK